MSDVRERNGGSHQNQSLGKRFPLRLNEGLYERVIAGARLRGTSANSEFLRLIALGLSISNPAPSPEDDEYQTLLEHALKTLRTEEKAAVLRLILTLVNR